MAVRSKQLWDRVQASPAGTDVVLYTVAPGETVLVKTMVFNNTSATVAATCYVGVGAVGPLATGSMLRVDVAVGAIEVVPCWYAFGPGTPIEIESSSSALRCSGFGAELEGVAD